MTTKVRQKAQDGSSQAALRSRHLRIPFVFGGVWIRGTTTHLHPFHCCSRSNLTTSRHRMSLDLVTLLELDRSWSVILNPYFRLFLVA